MKFMKASLEEFKNESIKPVDYLIQNVDDSNFLVHREVKENELHGYKKEEIFQYEGKSFLAIIANFPSEEEAIEGIHSYWNAIKQLNIMAK